MPVTVTRCAPPYSIRFPFGDWPIEGVLRVGREASFSPLASRLECYVKVSREHAELDATREPLTVTDLSSTNHVYINSQPIEPQVPTALQAGDEIWFSQALKALILERA